MPLTRPTGRSSERPAWRVPGRCCGWPSGGGRGGRMPRLICPCSHRHLHREECMPHLRHTSRRIATLLLAMAACTLTLAAATARERGEPPRSRAACATPEFRQFDFFTGDWDTYDMAKPAKLVARNRVTMALDGCAVREVYEQADGLVGESL